MLNTSFIKTLLERRVPQIIGSYFITGTTLVFFIQYLVDRYQFPTHYPTLALFAIIGILPSVIILSYFHGAPGKDYRYVVTSTRIWGNPDRGGNGAENSKVESISDILDNIKNQLKDIIGGASEKIGKVSEINDDIILVNLKDINVRRNMELKGTSTYDYGPGNSGYNNRLEDLKNAIDHIREKDGDGYNADLEFYNETYLALLADSLYCKYFDEGLHVDGCVQIRGQDYFLRVINVIDSVAVTKLIKFKYPWVKVRINDQVYVSIN